MDPHFSIYRISYTGYFCYPTLVTHRVLVIFEYDCRFCDRGKVGTWGESGFISTLVQNKAVNRPTDINQMTYPADIYLF